MNSSGKNTPTQNNRELAASVLLDLSQDESFSVEYRKALKLAAARRA